MSGLYVTQATAAAQARSAGSTRYRKQMLLQASAASSKRATSRKRCCKRCCRRCYCLLRLLLLLLLLLQARTPSPPRSCDLRHSDPFSGREDNEEEGGPIFSLWRRCLHSECRGAQVRSHVCLLVLAAAHTDLAACCCCCCCCCSCCCRRAAGRFCCLHAFRSARWVLQTC